MNDIAYLTLFSLILMRMSGFVLLNPILGRRNIPAIVKAGLILTLTVAVYWYSDKEVLEITSNIEYAFLLLKEFAAGYVVGYVIELFFFVISYAGFIIDFQMGLSMATVYDPQSNAQLPISGSIFQAYFVLLFFAVDGHLALMKILITSADIVPYGGILITQELGWHMVELFTECIVLAVKFSLPILAAEFLVEIAAGILNKIVPQINIFVINIQLKVIVGLVLLVVLFSPMSEYLTGVISTMLKTIQGILTFL